MGSGIPSFAPMLPVIVLAWRIRVLVRRFQELQAVSPDSAVPISTLAVRRGAVFRRLVRQGVIGTVGEDRYFLDPSRYQQWRSARRRRAAVLLAVIGVFLIVAWQAGWIRP